MKTLLSIFILATALVACSQNTTTPATPANPDQSTLSGTWEGTLVYTASGAASRRFEIEESDGVYTGSVYVCESSFGATCETDAIVMSVALEGQDITISYVEASDDFNGIVTITGVVKGNTITGEVIIVSDTVGIDMGTVTLERK